MTLEELRIMKKLSQILRVSSPLKCLFKRWRRPRGVETSSPISLVSMLSSACPMHRPIPLEISEFNLFSFTLSAYCLSCLRLGLALPLQSLKNKKRFPKCINKRLRRRQWLSLKIVLIHCQEKSLLIERRTNFLKASWIESMQPKLPTPAFTELTRNVFSSNYYCNLGLDILLWNNVSINFILGEKTWDM